MPCRVAGLLYRLEQSRGGERREREGGRKGPGFKLNFLKILNRNCDSLSTCKLGTLFVSVKYVLASVKLVFVYVKLLKT
jgi:hypothetical protein